MNQLILIITLEIICIGLIASAYVSSTKTKKPEQKKISPVVDCKLSMEY